MKVQLSINRKIYGALICSAACMISIFTACTDSSSDEIGPTAGGVTDIGNSIASGIVLNVAGSPVKGARVVAYYDSWTQAGIADSAETTTDSAGHYELKVDSSASYVLFASAGDDCGFVSEAEGSLADAEAAITIGPRRAYSGQIAGRHTGSVRIVGSDVITALDGDGYFILYDMPRGNITISYTDSTVLSEAADSAGTFPLQARIQFATVGDKNIYVLPKMNFLSQDSSWLTVERMDYYREDGYDGIHVTGPADTIRAEDENLLVSLSMDGSEKVFDNDSTLATSVEYVDGISGKAILLKPGQFIDLDSLDPSAGDFTISLWTKWEGPNGEHQILASQRAYWSDSTSRFQWHFESAHGKFVVLKSQPTAPEGFAFGDSSIVPVGEWANLVLVSENNMVSMYVNGEAVLMKDGDGNEVSAKEFVPNELDRKVPLRIGGDEIDTETWNGAMDELRIENVARSAEWIKEQFEKIKMAK